ncbi:hypothetical protein NKDENANG_02190 [Candidatus Entotheonellaceae bacterium PAL068K]
MSITGDESVPEASCANACLVTLALAVCLQEGIETRFKHLDPKPTPQAKPSRGGFRVC